MNWRRLLLAIAVLAYGAFIGVRMSRVVGGADSAGYFNYARLLRQGRVSLVVKPVVEMKLAPSWVEVFAPGGFKAAQRGARFVPTYPIGLPLHFALFSFWAVPVAASVCMLLMIAIARELELDWWRSVAGAVILGAFPVFLLTATQPLSDVVATMWALAAVYFGLRRWPMRAGVAFAIGVLVRPTNLLLAPLLLRFQKKLFLAAIPFGIGLLLLQKHLYGSPFLTGYGSGLLSIEHFRGAFLAHSRTLALQLTPIVFPLGLVAKRGQRAFVAAWFLPFFAFYSFYGAYDSWGTARFLLPAVPALILGALMLPVKRVVAAILIAAMIVVPIKQTRVLHVFEIARDERIYRDTVVWSERQMPRDAMVIAGLFSGAFLYYSDRFTANWATLDGDRWQVLRAYAGPRRWYAVLSDVELPPDQFRVRYPGRWVSVARMRDITLWRLEE